MKIIRNTKVVMAIMVFLAATATSLTMGVIRAVMAHTSENISETGAKNIVFRIAEDIRSACDKTGGGAAGPFWDQTDGSRIVITKNTNLDGYAVPPSPDTLMDVACYEYFPPTGVRGEANYRQGRIMAGTDSGDSVCEANNTVQLSDTSLDITDFQISYCRPAAGLPGTYTCNQEVAEPGNLATSSECVWLVRLNIETRRIPNGKWVNSTDIGRTTVFNTAVKPRNIYIGAIRVDDNNNDIVDCCDGEFVASDVDWCPVPRAQ